MISAPVRQNKQGKAFNGRFLFRVEQGPKDDVFSWYGLYGRALTQHVGSDGNRIGCCRLMRSFISLSMGSSLLSLITAIFPFWAKKNSGSLENLCAGIRGPDLPVLASRTSRSGATTHVKISEVQAASSHDTGQFKIHVT
jgi:hypothetical protein